MAGKEPTYVEALAVKDGNYGISTETTTPPDGVIVRKPGSEEPWGLIMETAFLPVFEQYEPTFPRDLANQMVKKVYEMKVPLILHCNGELGGRHEN